MKNNNIKLILVLLLCLPTLSWAQNVDNELQYRSNLDLSYKVNKYFKVYFTPEIRFDETFKADKYLLDAGLSYKAFKFLKFKGNYRYAINPRNNKATEYVNYYALSVKATKKMKDFDLGLRVKYTNDADDETIKEQFLRYKFSTAYDIPKCKFTPELGLEAFQQLGQNSSLYKMRYFAGFDYKLFKNNYIGAKYKFDYYNTQYLNKHIISLAYKIKF